jgi:hypothetical protein
MGAQKVATRRVWRKLVSVPTGPRPLSLDEPQPPPLPTLDAPSAEPEREEKLAPKGLAPPAQEQWFDVPPRFTDPSLPLIEPSPSRARAEGKRERRQRIVLTAVCGFGVLVFALAGLRLAARSLAERSSPDSAHVATQMALMLPSSAPPSDSSSTPQASPPPSTRATEATPAAATKPAAKAPVPARPASRPARFGRASGRKSI